MTLELRVPPVGESISEVQLGDWLKQEGQSVRKDEPVVLVESEKATIELPAPASGSLARILKKRGETARVGEVVGILELAVMPSTTPGEPRSPLLPSSGAAGPSLGVSRGANPSRVMPAARRILEESRIPASRVTGTGPGGRVTKDDALVAARQAEKGTATPSPAAASGPTPDDKARETPSSAPPRTENTPPIPDPIRASAPRASNPDDEVIPMSPLRRTVARRLVEAQSAMALLTTFNEVDMSAVAALRRQYQEAFSARHGVKLGFMPFFVKAAIDALRQFPQLNAEVRDQNIVYHRYFDIGVAIGGGKGLVVPILRGADRMSFAQVEKAIADFGVRAKDGKIKPDELVGGTFTITNGGVFGSLLSTPIINPPQSGILGMHTIQDRPVVVDGQIVIRPMMYVALTYDHRIVDGREAVTFLKRVKETVESPARMLLEA